MDIKNLRSIHGKLNDLAFDVARLDTMVKHRRWFTNELEAARADRQIAGLYDIIRDDAQRIANDVIDAVEPVAQRRAAE